MPFDPKVSRNLPTEKGALDVKEIISARPHIQFPSGKWLGLDAEIGRTLARAGDPSRYHRSGIAQGKAVSQVHQSRDGELIRIGVRQQDVQGTSQYQVGRPEHRRVYAREFEFGT